MSTPLRKGRRSTQRKRLVAGMIAAANRDGYPGANVSAVIAQAGVSRPTFYDYFADKNDCFLAAFGDVQEKLLAEIRCAVEEEASRLPSHAAVRALVDFASSQTEMARFLMSEALAGGPGASDARDRAIDEIALTIERAEGRAAERSPAPDLSIRAMLGAVQRLLASRLLRRGLAGRDGLLEDVLGWLESYERPAAEHRWRELSPAKMPARSAAGAGAHLRAPMSLTPGRQRLSAGEVAENHRQRLLFAAARQAAEHGYTATTIAEVTELAGLDRRAFYAIFQDKRDLFMAVHEFGFQRLLAASAGAFFTGPSWPRRVWEGTRGLAEFLQSNPTIANASFVEAYAVGPGAVQRVEDSVSAFTVFLQEGYRHEPKSAPPPSALALEAIVSTLFEIVYRRARERARSRLDDLTPHMSFIALAPFLGTAAADQAIDAEMMRSRGREGPELMQL